MNIKRYLLASFSQQDSANLFGNLQQRPHILAKPTTVKSIVSRLHGGATSRKQFAQKETWSVANVCLEKVPSSAFLIKVSNTGLGRTEEV